MTGPRRQTLWRAALLHRLSGLGLAAFLPLHFLFLGESLVGEAALDSALAWTRYPLVKAAEMGLVFLLTVHLLGGVRLLVLENFAWRDWQKTWASIAAGASLLVAFLFLYRVL